MQKSLPNQTEVLNWMSVFLIEKLNQATQNQDWQRALAASVILQATTECTREIKRCS